MLARLAGLLHTRGRAVLAAAVVVAAVSAVFGAGVAGGMSPYGANDPATQSVQATNRFEAAAHRQLVPGVTALVGTGPVGTRAARRLVSRVVAKLRAGPDVATVLSYYATRNRAMVARDGRSTYLLAYFRPRSDKTVQDDAKQIAREFAGWRRVTLGGAALANAEVNSQVSHDLGHAELLAFPFIFLLSLIFFRSLVAAVLPPLLGGLAILVTFFALRLVSQVVDLSVFALNFVTGMGLGLAIDYSLFMVSRYREESAVAGFGREALVRTLQSAGRTIAFSSVTIAAAVASLAVLPQRFLYSMGIAGAIVALIAASLALTVLPALLGVLGPRVNALSPRRLQRAAHREARPARQGGWFRLSQLVTRRAPVIAIASAALLIALGIPFVHIKFIEADERVLPPSAPARVVHDVLARDFPRGRVNPLEVVVGSPPGSPQVRSLAAKISRLPDVAGVARAQPVGASGALLEVAAVRDPQSAATQRLVKQVRAIHEPFYVGVAGETASFVDLEHSLVAHLPAVLAIVVGATLIVLFLMTGSVVLPIKAVVMNALSLSAMLGILVWIFQDGHLQGLLSFHTEGALDATQPVFLFAVGFGLATDYGVFLLSRIKEARDGGAPNREAVAIGLERTGRIVTAAALLFAVAIGAFATSKIVFLKELGVGAALAVLIDASIIRALLVPSLMEMLGSVNWWAPKPLRRLHERLGLRETPGPQAMAANTGG